MAVAPSNGSPTASTQRYTSVIPPNQLQLPIALEGYHVHFPIRRFLMTVYPRMTCLRNAIMKTARRWETYVLDHACDPFKAGFKRETKLSIHKLLHHANDNPLLWKIENGSWMVVSSMKDCLLTLFVDKVTELVITSFPRRWGRKKQDPSGVYRTIRERSMINQIWEMFMIWLR
jgi:hypothetical protein